jgi:cytochrome b6-f complex iron-sulfur subunit
MERRREENGGEKVGKRPQNANESAAPETSRRSVLSWFVLTLGGAALVEAVWVTASFLKPRKKQSAAAEQDTIVVAGPVDAFERNSVTAFQKGKFYLVRLDDGGFLALHRKCTHLGCTVPWNAEQHRFACPCHASSFDIRGNVLTPPAPRPLDLFPVRIENDIVKVRIDKPITRTKFEPDQVTRS